MSPANPSGTNTLALATSPYLRQHADNPVHWQQWTPQALAEAAARAVPILLSVGYAACHWCHVMAHESFDDDEVAAAPPPATGVTSWPTSHSTTTRWPRP
ncbi:transmembrane protein [Mycobacterium tuberculosis]|nr:transmembrane protein [Mycobacterium tuberculosis]